MEHPKSQTTSFFIFVLFSMNTTSVMHPDHGLRTPREEIVFTAWPKIQSQSQIFRYGRSIFRLPHRPNFSDIFDFCLHWMSVVRDPDQFDSSYDFWTISDKICHREGRRWRRCGGGRTRLSRSL